MSTRTRARTTSTNGFSGRTTIPAVTWESFRTRYTSECLCFLARATQRKVSGIFDSIELILHPKSIEDLDAAAISKWSAKRKSDWGIADATLKGNLMHLRSALAWAVEQKMLTEVPAIRTPPRAKGQKMMKGRAVTQVEFDKMLGCCQDEAQRFFVRGLWLSGLRLSEALALSWDNGQLCIDLSGEFPMFKIPADCDKGNQDRLLPMAPEFAQMLAGVLQAERVGKVFKTPWRSLNKASVAVTAIGEAAGVVVDVNSGKFASAHDLRRSFGERWASRVMPAILMQLMRHESIETTMRYYVGANAQEVARHCWASISSSSS